VSLRGSAFSAACLAGATIALAGAGQAEAASNAAATSLVAQATGSTVTVHRSPKGGDVQVVLANPGPFGAQRVFLVKSRRPGWEQIYLPVRPNGTTGWVQDDTVQLAIDDYSVSVSLGAKTVSVYKDGALIDRYKAATGTSATPTPRGHFYIDELLAQPNPGGAYGPYAFGLSAFSDVLFGFGGGPGQVGLHGTNDSAAIGSGASHGCIRIANAAIIKLAHMLPLGTPVVITQ
jgi:lipoprotein-anchoring transpeptidase ErfK/SrfK